MAQQTLNNGDSGLVARGKLNDNFTDLYTNKLDKLVTIDSKPGDYTLVLTDREKSILMGSASANILTVPTNASVAFPVGTLIYPIQYGAGVTTIAPAGGVTIRSSSTGMTAPSQYSSMVLEKIGTDEWMLFNGSPPISVVSVLAILTNTSALVSTNPPNSEQALAASSNLTAKFDSTSYNFVRLVLRVNTLSGSANTPRCYPQYDASASAGGPYTTAGAGTVGSGEAVSIASTGFKTTSWIALTGGAKADLWWRVAENGGDGAADPAYSAIYLEFKT